MLTKGTNGMLLINNKALNSVSKIVFEVKTVKTSREGRQLGIEFVSTNPQQRADIVSLVHGDSDRWVNYWEHRPGAVGKLKGMALLVYWGIKHSRLHVIHLVKKINLLFFKPSLSKRSKLESNFNEI